jgi:hypothetical protein
MAFTTVGSVSLDGSLYGATATWLGGVVPSGRQYQITLNGQIVLDANYSVGAMDPNMPGTLVANTNQFRLAVGAQGIQYVVHPVVV